MATQLAYNIREFYLKQISGQSRKITQLQKENKKLRVMLKQLTDITVELNKAYQKELQNGS